ncbi:MAG: hypothetical protein HY727_17440 [Candidatus Rokubacteria bacterium]|nr:hypothetical protein [Candidatus Rokubacteria bacterium]
MPPSLALLMPGTAATRWLLLADLACLLLLGLATRRPRVAVPATLGAGFVALNTLGMVVNDFYVGLLLFHVAVGLTAATLVRRTRWIGAAQILLTLLLGVAT